jgi:hypothetical protein
MTSTYSSHHEERNLALRILALIASSALFTGISFLFAKPVKPQIPATIQIAQTEAIRTTSAQQGKLYLNNDRSYSYNLIVSNGATIDGVPIPAGAVIRGQYVPAKGGLRYVANAVEFNGRSYAISANSDVIEDVKDPRDTTAGSIAEDAGIGAAGGLVIGEIFGDADLGEAIGGAAAGAAVGNITADRVVVIQPNAPIVLYSR